MKPIYLAVALLGLGATVPAQASSRWLLDNLAPVCRKAIDREVPDLVSKYPQSRVDKDSVCRCATERVASDAVFKRIAGLTQEKAQALPDGERAWMHLVLKTYGLSLARQAEAVNAAVDGLGALRDRTHTP